MVAPVAFEGITKSFRNRAVLRGIDLAVSPGRFTVLYGPPAAGKTTLMRILMGLEAPDGGRLVLRGQEATTMPPAQRAIGYTPQSFALYPHRSVWDNIAYPLQLTRVPKTETAATVERVAGMLKIGDLLGKRPDQLSGGQKQRVAIARGIARQTDLYVLDDPLAGLDFKLREQLVDDLRDLQAEAGVTMLYTTADPLEAMGLAEEIAILDGGTIIAHGDPERIYNEPADVRSMALFGFPRANVLPGRLGDDGDGPVADFGIFRVPVKLEAGPAGMAVQGGIRPESLRFGDGSAGSVAIEADVLLREDIGGEEILFLDCRGTALSMVRRHHDSAGVGSGRVTIPVADVLIFDEGGRRIGRGRPKNGTG